MTNRLRLAIAVGALITALAVMEAVDSLFHCNSYGWMPDFHGCPPDGAPY